MLHSIADPQFTYRYLSSVIDGRNAVAIRNTIHHWVKHHGVEWTIRRMKDLKQGRIHFEAGTDYTPTYKCRSNMPVGSFRYLWKLSFKRALKVFNLYTCEIFDSATLQQKNKFYSSVEQPPIHEGLLPWIKFVPDSNGQQSDFHLERWYSTRKRAPTYHPNLKKFVSVPEENLSIEQDLWDLCAHNGFGKIVSEHKQLFAACYSSQESYITRAINNRKRLLKTGPEIYSEYNEPVVSGKIAFIQERGGKLRAVANPFRPFQAALTPFSLYLMSVLQDQPWDCTFNQEDGIQFVQESLSMGHTCFCVDLSDATNNFPLNLQIKVLKKMLRKASSLADPVKDGLILFEKLSRGRWFDKNNPNSNYTRWTKGQPLGLYPSFFAFALTHGLLLKNLSIGLGITENSFRVLGDDVVIINKRLYEDYVSSLTRMGCPISMDKTIVSSSVAEFAGKIITPDGVVSPEKWQPYSASNPIGPLCSLGPSGIRFVPQHVRKKVSAFAALPEPIGIGLNPRGLSLEDRCTEKVSEEFFKWTVDRPYVNIPRRSNKIDWDRYYQSVYEASICTGFPYRVAELSYMPTARKAYNWEEIWKEHILLHNKDVLLNSDLLPVNFIKPVPARGRPDKVKHTGFWMRIRKLFG
jgi:hypothetical protein